MSYLTTCIGLTTFFCYIHEPMTVTNNPRYRRGDPVLRPPGDEDSPARLAAESQDPSQLQTLPTLPTDEELAVFLREASASSSLPAFSSPSSSSTAPSYAPLSFLNSPPTTDQKNPIA